MTSAAVERSPWDRWGWAFAAIWLVFLAYPVLEILDSSHPVAVKVLGLLVVVAFGAVHVIGVALGDARPWLPFGLLVALALALVPIIEFGAIGLTPYLGGFAALQLPGPWWQRVTAIVALVPLLSLVSGGSFPAFFFALAWVLREAVTNVVRHSGAHEVVIELSADGLVVTDDGSGFAGTVGNGLRGMRERVEAAGGTLTLAEAAPGTRLQVVL